MRHAGPLIAAMTALAALAGQGSQAQVGITPSDKADIAARRNDPTSPPPDMSRNATGSLAVPATTQTAGSASAVLPARSKRILVPRTGSAPPSGISGTSGISNQSGGRSNGINDGSDPSRGANGGAGTISAPLGSRPLQPRDKDTSPTAGRHSTP